MWVFFLAINFVFIGGIIWKAVELARKVWEIRYNKFRKLNSVQKSNDMARHLVDRVATQNSKKEPYMSNKIIHLNEGP